MDVKIGDWIEDNDPRRQKFRAQVLQVIRTGSTFFAVYFTGKRKARVRFDRIFENDGIQRHQGWTLIARSTDPVPGTNQSAEVIPFGDALS